MVFIFKQANYLRISKEKFNTYFERYRDIIINEMTTYCTHTHAGPDVLA